MKEKDEKQNDIEPKIKPTGYYVKFSKDVVIGKTFLEKHNVQYSDTDLENTHIGMAYVIRNENEHKQSLPN